MIKVSRSTEKWLRDSWHMGLTEVTSSKLTGDHQPETNADLMGLELLKGAVAKSTRRGKEAKPK